MNTKPTALSTIILLSGSGTNLQAIIEKCHNTGIIDIKAVLSNRPEAQGLVRAKKASIPTYTIDHQDYPQRADFDNALIEIIDTMKPELIVLTGFMRILTPRFVQHYLGKIINAHPSLLPKFPGCNTYQKALAEKEKYHGSTVHFVTEALDQGPIIAQGKVAITTDETIDSLTQKVKAKEHEILPKVITWYAQGRLYFKDYQAFLDNQLLDNQVAL